MPLSVVIIICKKDAAGIRKTLQSVCDLDADLVLYDTSKTGLALAAANEFHVRWYEGEWAGFEQVRYNASLLAKHNWILMLHTGEELDQELRNSLSAFDYSCRNAAYRIRFKSLYENKWLNHGEWGGKYHIRFANRAVIRIPNEKINESIIANQGFVVRKLKGSILHAVIGESIDLKAKLTRDAHLAALQYLRHGHPYTLVHQIISPVISFCQGFFFKLGFLDGKIGFRCARMMARYTYLKYAWLKKLKMLLKGHPETAKYPK